MRRIIDRLLICALLSAAACASPPQTYEERIATWRAEKDAAFRSGSDSPIPEPERAAFEGLAYFDIDPAYRVPAALVESGMSSQVIEMDTTDGRREKMRVIGRLDFTIGGERHALTAFLPETAQNRERLFVPFRDATNREETYGGGRYLDLSRSPTGLYDLDFNRAYNPFCVYDPEYVCPLPPRENTLPLEIKAGEKMPRGKVGVRGSTFEVLPGEFRVQSAGEPGTRERAQQNIKLRTSNLELS